MKHKQLARANQILGAVLSVLAVISVTTFSQAIRPIGPEIAVPRPSILTIELDVCEYAGDAVLPCGALVVESYAVLVDTELLDRTVTRKLIEVDESTAPLEHPCTHVFQHVLSDADKALLTHHNANPRLRITVSTLGRPDLPSTETFEFSIPTVPPRYGNYKYYMVPSVRGCIYASVSVRTNFPMPQITNIRFNPRSPATLGFNDQVTFTFDYTTTEPGGVYIWGTPFTGGRQSGGLAQHGSVVHPTGEGSLSGWFTIRSGEKTVDQVRFQITDTDRNVLYEAFVDVSYTYR